MVKPVNTYVGTDEFSDELKSVFPAVQAIRKGWDTKKIPDQPILDAESPSYQAMHLKDGSVHWIVALQSVSNRPVVAAIATDPQTGMWYALAVYRDSISYVCDYPPEMVKKKYKSPPMGFAAAIPREELGLARGNGKRL